MKTIRDFALIAVLTCSHIPLNAQGTVQFQNLDFEAASVQMSQSQSVVSSASALPGWTVYFGSSLQTQVGCDLVALGSTWVTLVGTNSDTVFNRLQGDFGVLLQGGSTAPYAAISQTGLVPANAQSLLFNAQPGLTTLQVSLGGVSLPFFAISAGPNYATYACDVSAFAGKSDELTFSALSNIAGNNNWNIDSIQFSPTPVPEPAGLGIITLGGFLMLWQPFLPGKKRGQKTLVRRRVELKFCGGNWDAN